jgi:protein-S-isoprenylcysteine O-methyltransferase Ste14
MLAAVAVWIGTLPFFAAAVGFFLIVQIAFCPYEESKLRTTFGAEYDRYANAVRRWC